MIIAGSDNEVFSSEEDWIQDIDSEAEFEDEDEVLPHPEPTDDEPEPDFQVAPDACTWVSQLSLTQLEFGPPSRPLFDFENPQDPVSIFNTLFTSELFDTIVQEMNNYAEELFLRGSEASSRIGEWRTLEVDEFKVFLGLLFHTGTISLKRLEDYWKTNYLFNLPCWRQHMSRNRFQLILRCLHFNRSPESDETPDRLHKIKPLLDYFNNRMIEINDLSREVSIDESMLLWRGRLFWRQFIKGKRHKYGIKLYMLCKPSGFIQKNFSIHGKQRSRNRRAGSQRQSCERTDEKPP